MLAGISLTCFTASYTVALALELSRMWFRSGMRGAAMLGFAAAGLLAHTLFLAYRAVTTVGTPLSSEFDWYLIAAWALTVVYLVWTGGQLRAPVERRAAVGLFILPIVLGLVAAAHFVASREGLPRERALGVWVIIHLALLVSGLVSILVGFIAGSMELLQAYRLKHKYVSRAGFRLPSLERLERSTLRSIYVSCVLLTSGLATGILLNFIAGRISWTDPTVWRLVVVVAWELAVAAFVTLYRPARQGRKAAYLAIASAAVVLASIGLGHLLPSDHGAPPRETERRNAGAPGPSVVVAFPTKEPA